PTAAGERRGEVGLAARAEARVVPELAVALALDRDLDRLEAAQRVGCVPAEAAGAVEAGVVVFPTRAREREGRARVAVVDPERAARPRLCVADVVGRADVDDVVAVRREARGRERERPVRSGQVRGVERLARGA